MSPDPLWFHTLAAFEEVLAGVRGARDEHRHSWRVLEFVRHANNHQGIVGDLAAVEELSQFVRLGLAELRVLEMDLRADLAALREAVGAPARPSAAGGTVAHVAEAAAQRGARARSGGESRGSPESWEVLRDLPPWAVLAALRATLDPAVVGKLTIDAIAGLPLLTPHELATKKRALEPNDAGGKRSPREPDEPAVVAETIGAPSAALLRRAELEARAAHAERVRHLRRRRRPEGEDGNARLLALALSWLGRHRSSMRRICEVLASARLTVEQWVETLPPGMPELGHSYRRDRESLYRILRAVNRVGADDVRRLAGVLVAEKPNRRPTPTVAFTDMPDARMSADRSRVAILVPRTSQDAPMYLISVLHECAHGFIPHPERLTEPGEMAEWIQGPLRRVLHAYAMLPPDVAPVTPDQFRHAVVELTADLVAMAVGGPHLVSCLLMMGLPETAFNPAPHGRIFLDVLQRVGILYVAARRVWEGEDPFAAGASSGEEIPALLSAYLRALQLFATGNGDPYGAEVARRLLVFQAELVPALETYATVVLRRLVVSATGDVGLDWRFGKPEGPWADLVSRVGAAIGHLTPTVSEARRHGLVRGLGLACRPLRESATDRDFLVRNTLHLLWSDWQAAVAAGEPADGSRATLLFLHHATLPNGALEESPGQCYFGSGRPWMLTWFDHNWGPGLSHRKPAGDVVVLHALGRYDFVTCVPVPTECADPGDHAHYGSLDVPSFTRQQELEVLQWPGRPSEPFPPTTDLNSPIFYFLHSFLFGDRKRPDGGYRGEVDSLLKAIEGPKRGIAEVRAVCRSFTWAELAFVVAVHSSPMAAIECLCAAGSGPRRAPVQTFTQTLIRETDLFVRVQTHYAAGTEPKKGPESRIRAMAAAAGGTSPRRLRMLFRIWLSHERRETGVQLRTALHRVFDGTGVNWTFADALGEEDFVLLVEVPDEVTPPTVLSCSTALFTQAWTAVLLLDLLDLVNTHLRICEVATHLSAEREH